MKTLNKISILVVEDDLNLRNQLKECLEAVEYKVYTTRTTVDGLEIFKKYDIDLCIYGVKLNDNESFALATQIKVLNPDMPFIFIADRGMHVDMLKGFEFGIDDYVMKPFTNDELLLRVKSVMHRMERNNPFAYTLGDDKITLGKFVFDTKNMMLIHNGKEQSLTRKEAALLKVLYDNKNELLTRKKALKMIWGNSDYFIGRSMDVFIARLRKYLKADPNVRIMTVHGVGFRLVVNDDVPQSETKTIDKDVMV